MVKGTVSQDSDFAKSALQTSCAPAVQRGLYTIGCPPKLIQPRNASAATAAALRGDRVHCLILNIV